MTNFHRKHAIATACELRDNPYPYIGYAEIVKGDLRNYTKGWKLLYKENRAAVYGRKDMPECAMCLGQSAGMRLILRIDYSEEFGGRK